MGSGNRQIGPSFKVSSDLLFVDSLESDIVILLTVSTAFRFDGGRNMGNVNILFSSRSQHLIPAGLTSNISSDLRISAERWLRFLSRYNEASGYLVDLGS
ncbi:hypothetical protein AVEN_196821-1 [Araneus ventricosus]|uniref:Uncharacterized protein n=1 Tax=Araneus ventricosus TaxID=182803 RepID=A0A4Y2JF91_ARAVE|nr:hypothetical protein AVEN_196821-1 [Araneus ventricosus]